MILFYKVSVVACMHIPNLSARPLMLGCEHHWFLWQHMQRIPQAVAFPNFFVNMTLADNICPACPGNRSCQDQT